MRTRSLLAAGAALAAVLLAVRLSGPRLSSAPTPPPTEPALYEPVREAPRPELPRQPERLPQPSPVPEPRFDGGAASPGLRAGDLFVSVPAGMPAEVTSDGKLLFKWWFTTFSYEPRRGSGWIAGNKVRVTLDGRDLGALPVPRRVSREDGTRWLKVPAGDPLEAHTIELHCVLRSDFSPPHHNRVVLSREAGAGTRWKRVLLEEWYDGGDPAVFKRTVRRFPQ